MKKPFSRPSEDMTVPAGVLQPASRKARPPVEQTQAAPLPSPHSQRFNQEILQVVRELQLRVQRLEEELAATRRRGVTRNEGPRARAAASEASSEGGESITDLLSAIIDRS